MSPSGVLDFSLYLMVPGEESKTRIGRSNGAYESGMDTQLPAKLFIITEILI